MSPKHNQRPNYGSSERKKQNIRGHDAVLHHFQRTGEKVTIFLATAIRFPRQQSSSSFINGTLTQYDAYTITLEVEGQTHPIILFKGNVLGLTKSQLG